MNKDQERKNTPVYSGFVAYFPRAIEEVARVSLIANEQHNPGQPLHWDKTKSMAHKDSGLRHEIDIAKGEVMDDDGTLHLAKKAWRAMADLEIYLENETAIRTSKKNTKRRTK
jgi:hypothetical protein